MNWDQIEGSWSEFKSSIRQNWTKITDQQLNVIAGNRNHLLGKIQVMYGISRQEAEHQLSDWQDSQINIDGHFYQPKAFTQINHL